MRLARPIVWALFGLLAGVVHADEPPSNAEQAEQAESARIHFQAGREYYADGHHDKAFAEFVEAYRLSGRPELLFNRGLCLEAMHYGGPALACYREYLANAMALDRAEPERRQKELERRVAPADVPATCPTALPATPPPPPPPKPPLYKRWWLWTAVGVVAAAAIAGGVAGGVLAARHNELPVFPGVTPQ